MGKIILNNIEYGIGITNGSNIDTTNLVEKDSIVTTLDDTVTDEDIPSAKAVYDKLSDLPTDSGSKCYTSLDELGLTADATIEDVVNALKNGESFLAPVNTFTNYETIFPNKVPNDQWNKIHIIKGTSLANSHIRCLSQSGTSEYLANVNNTNVTGWNDVSGTYVDITDAIIEKLGNEILKYPVGKYRINSTTTANKFTDLPSNAKSKCGLIEINGTAVGKSPFTDTWVYRMYKFECLTGTSSYLRRLNSGATVGQIEDDTGWQNMQMSDTKKTAPFNSKTFKIDITKGNQHWNGNMKFGYCVDESYGEINICSLGTTSVTWDCSTGVRYVKSVTYTIDPNNKAHVTIGVELYDTVYGIHQLETCGDFATINSFTGDAFTGTSVATRGATRGRNNGVGILCEVEDLGLTKPCTTVQIAQEMRALANSMSRIPQSGLIGIFDNNDKSITDSPTSYGLLEIKSYGYDRVMIRYDGISANNYNGSWIGKIKGSNGSFSSIEWERIDGVVSTGGEPDVYSTSEQAIGTWVDGKTIYRKTIVKDSHGVNGQLISGVDTFIRGYGTCERAGYVYNVPHCGLLAGHLQDEDVPYLNFKLDTNGALSTIGSSTYTISKLKVTLEYTKK